MGQSPQQQLEGMIMEAAKRNPLRDHEPQEWAIDFSNPPKFQMPLPAVILAVSALVERGELAQRTWNGEQVVYGLPEAAND